jgi:hypothetical protein
MKISFSPLDADAVVFLSEETGVDFRSARLGGPDRWFCASARNDHGAVVGALACEFKSSFNAHFSIAIADPHCLNYRVLHAVFVALFSKAKRLTALIDPDNKKAIKEAHQLGFVVEGYLKYGMDGQRDALLMGMTADTCRWLKPRKRRVPARAAIEIRKGF